MSYMKSHPLQSAQLGKSMLHPVFATESFNGPTHPLLLDILELIAPPRWSEIHFGGLHYLQMLRAM